MMKPSDYQLRVMREFLQLKAEQKQITERVDEIQARIVRWMKESDTRTVEVSGHALTVTTGQTHTYDMDALKELGHMFERVTKVTVDTPKFNAAEKMGLIPPGVRKSKDNKSYLRVS